MGSSPLAVVVDCANPSRLARFWADALSGQVTQRNQDEFQVNEAAGGWTSLYFMKVPETKSGKNRLHLDVVTEGSMEIEVSRLVGLGARVVQVRHDPSTLDNPDTWTVMEDPEGNEFCVLNTASVTGWV